MLDRLYQWTLDKAAHPHAVWWLAFFAFIEAIFFPIPADVMLVPLIIAARQRAWFLATVCGLASATGGMLGWAIGFYAYESIGAPIVEFYGLTEQVATLRAEFDRVGAWVVTAGAISPIPYKLVTIASGLLHMDFWEFNLVSYPTRLARFLVVGALLYWTGPWIKAFMDRHLKLFTALVVIGVVGGFLVVYYLL